MGSEINVNIQTLFATQKEASPTPKTNIPVNIETNNGVTSVFDNSGVVNCSSINMAPINPYVKGDSSKVDGIFDQLSNGGNQKYNLEADARNISSNLKEVIYSDEFGRPSKVLEIIENQVDPVNIDIILREYEKLTNGRTLQEDLDCILKFSPFKKKKINDTLDKIQNFEKLNTSVNNKHWKGDPHNIIRDGSTFTITNTATNETREIDLSKLLADFDSSQERKNFIETMQNLPAEVLMDMAAEQSELIELEDNPEVNVGDDKTVTALAYYTSGTDQVALQDDCPAGAIIHELGHALDYNRISGSNKSSVSNNETYMNIFNEEMEKFIADGNKRYVYGDEDNQPGTDATVNEQEMFAACYTLLMTGDCSNKATIEKYFPRMLGYVRQLVEYNRSHSDEIRH